MQDTWPSSAHYSRKSKDTDGSSKPVMETNNVQVKMDENEKRKKKGGGEMVVNRTVSNFVEFVKIRFDPISPRTTLPASMIVTEEMVKATE